MKNKHFLYPIGLVVFFMSTIAYAASQQQAEEALATAEKLLLQSTQADHEWTTVKPLIKQAKKALKSNQFDNAYSFAVKASEQSTLALKQAENEKSTWALNLPN